MDNSNNYHQEEVAITTPKNTDTEEEIQKDTSIPKTEPVTTNTSSTIPTATPAAKNSNSSDELPIPSTSRALIPFNPNPIPLIPVSSVTATPVTPASSKTPTDPEDERKPDSREHKKRSKNWTRIETLTLIRLRTQLAPRFAKAGRKSELWDEIADTLRKNNFTRDAQQCRDKWEKLMAGYKEVRDGIKSKEDNPYYEELHPLLSNRPVKREREPAEGNEVSHVRIEAPPVRTTPPAGIGTVLKAMPIASSMPSDAHHHSHHHQQQQHHRHQHHSHNQQQHQQHLFRNLSQERVHQSSFRGPYEDDDAQTNEDNDHDDGDENDGRLNPRKKPKLVSSSDMQALQALVESIISRQQKFFKDLLEAIDKKEQHREMIRLEREEKWRAEERAQRLSFAEAMNFLTQKLTGDETGGGFVPPPPTASASAAMAPISVRAGAGSTPMAMHHATPMVPVAPSVASSMQIQHQPSTTMASSIQIQRPTSSTHTEPLQVSSVSPINPLTTVSPVNTTTTTPPTVGVSSAADTPSVAASPSNQGPKKRSKNWKRTEVLQLIKLRGEMDEKFVKSTRRAPLWDELAEALASQSISRDGKQCREKWDKLMSEYKEVMDGKKDKGDSPYFPELQAALDHGRLGEAG